MRDGMWWKVVLGAEWCISRCLLSCECADMWFLKIDVFFWLLFVCLNGHVGLGALPDAPQLVL